MPTLLQLLQGGFALQLQQCDFVLRLLQRSLCHVWLRRRRETTISAAPPNNIIMIGHSRSDEPVDGIAVPPER